MPKHKDLFGSFPSLAAGEKCVCRRDGARVPFIPPQTSETRQPVGAGAPCRLPALDGVRSRVDYVTIRPAAAAAGASSAVCGLHVPAAVTCVALRSNRAASTVIAAAGRAFALLTLSGTRNHPHHDRPRASRGSRLRLPDSRFLSTPLLRFIWVLWRFPPIFSLENSLAVNNQIQAASSCPGMSKAAIERLLHDVPGALDTFDEVKLFEYATNLLVDQQRIDDAVRSSAGRFGLKKHELIWTALYPFLYSHGYKPRSRYRPGWQHRGTPADGEGDRSYWRRHPEAEPLRVRCVMHVSRLLMAHSVGFRTTPFALRYVRAHRQASLREDPVHSHRSRIRA